MSSDVPEIPDHRGPWDERLAYSIVALPFVAIGLLVIGYFVGVATGAIPLPTREFWMGIYDDVGTIAVYASMLLLGATWVLSLMKVFGAKPVTWLGRRIRGAAVGTQPFEQLEERGDR